MRTWPYLGIVACLFVMAVLAGQAWRPRHDSPQVPQQPAKPIGYPPAERHAPTDRRFGATLLAADTKSRSGEPQLTAQATTPPARNSKGTSADRRQSPASAAKQDAPPWPVPMALVTQLDRLSGELVSSQWALGVKHELQSLRGIKSLSSSESAAVLAKLRSLADQVDRMQDRVEGPGWRSELLRARYALERRLDIWQTVGELAANSSNCPIAADLDVRPMLARVQAAERLLAGHDRDEVAWRHVLMLQELSRLARAADHADRHAQRQLARRILQRCDPRQLSQLQRAFLQRPAAKALLAELRQWATEPVDYQSLLGLVEALESNPSASTERPLADIWNVLRFSSCAGHVRLAHALGMHYRNANIRFAATEELLNRFVPAVDVIQQPVCDEILGSDVCGTSSTRTQLSVRLVPDKNRLGLRVEAQGVVHSDTQSSRWPVTIDSTGQSSYVAHKMFFLDQDGWRATHAGATATSCTQTHGIQSAFDAIPLVGAMVRGTALRRQEEQCAQIYCEIEQKVAGRVSRHLDREADRRVALARSRFEGTFIEPFRRLAVDPVALETTTTEDELAVRCRLAGDGQLAAYTPRPQAQRDSVASLQIHQSALNNVLDQMALDGRRSDLRELYQHVATALGLDNAQVPEDLPRGVTVELADEESLRIQCAEGRVSITLRVAELTDRSGIWRHFVVRSHYRLEPTGTLEAILVRDGTIELIGQDLGLRRQISLRAIFTKVFARTRPVPLLDSRLAQNPRLDDLTVDHYTISDGWIGLEIGKKAVAQQRVAKPRPSVPRS
jgi:hypothetical protein